MTVTSIHVLRYAEDRDWDELRIPPPPASYWHPGVTAPADAAGIPCPDGRSWTVLACWPSRQDWQEALQGPGPWQGSEQAWSALLQPGPTRDLPAAAQWAGGRTTPPFGLPQPPVPGPVAVLTTVGLAPDDLGEVLRFVADVERVVDTLAATPGSAGFRLGSAEHFPSQVDAFTFSLWDDMRAARRWAYGEGVHAGVITAHSDRPHITRGSFTAFSVLETCGTWSDRHVLRARVDA